MDVCRKSTGQILSLNAADKIGAGGEADVFAVSGAGNLVAKIYRRPEIQHARKIEAMLSSAPENLKNILSRVAIAWPVDMLYEANGHQSCIGFLMPRISGQRSIIDVFNPQSRKRLDPFFNYPCLLRAARNLAAAVSALHKANCVIGDLNETNTWVGRDSRITLVDCDSFQVRDAHTGETFRCNVGKAEYTPPELQGERFSEVYREREHDLFGLAVLIFQLLMEGTGPFAGVPLNSDDESVIADRIARGHFPYGTKPVPYRPPPFAPPFSVLHPKLQTLFVQCFETGYERPDERPAAVVWENTIHEVEVLLKTCSRNPKHVYCDHLNSCPWCERTKRLGGEDPFPSVRPVAPKQVITPSARRSTRSPTNKAAPVAPNPQRPAPVPKPVTSVPPPARAKRNREAGCLIWLGILLAIGVLQQLGNRGTIQPTPGERTPQRELGPTPDATPSPTPEAAPSLTPEATPSPTRPQTQVPSTLLFNYRARLSLADHFNSKGVDLRKVPNIKIGDILLQDRVNFYQLRRGDAEDQADPYYARMSFKNYRALFEDKPVSVFPAGGEEVIINGTPLVDVTVRGGSIDVAIVDAGLPPPGQLVQNPTPIPTPTPTTTPGWQKPVTEFVRSFVAAISGHNVHVLPNYYAPTVSYFTYGDVDGHFIVKDVKDLFRKWPIRSYSLAGEPAVTQGESNGVYFGVIDTSFRIENKREIISGKSRFRVRIRLSEGRYAIDYIRQETLDQNAQQK